MTDDLKALRMEGSSGFHDYFVVDTAGDCALGMKPLVGWADEEGSFVACRIRAAAHPDKPKASAPSGGWKVVWPKMVWAKHSEKYCSGLVFAKLQNALPAVMLHEIKKVDIATIVAKKLSGGFGPSPTYTTEELSALLQREWTKLLVVPDEGEDSTEGKADVIDLAAVLAKKPEIPPNV